MKTSLNEKLTLEQLNSKADKVNFSHRVLRAKLIGEKYFNTHYHTRGKFYFENRILFVAYMSYNSFCYAPMLGVNSHIN